MLAILFSFFKVPPIIFLMKMTISGKVEKSSLETNDNVQLSCKILKIYIYIYIYIDKELPPWWFRWLRICIEGDLGLIPGLERSPGEGNGYPLHIFAWRIPWTEEPGGLQSMGLQRVRQGWVTNTFTVGGISLVAQTVKNLLAMWETWIWSWDQKDPLEKGMDTHSSILAWRIP